MKTKENKNDLLGNQLKSESYLSVLQKENAEKEATIKKQNSMIAKFKIQIDEGIRDKENLNKSLKEKEEKIKSLTNTLMQNEKDNMKAINYEEKYKELEANSKLLQENNEKLKKDNISKDNEISSLNGRVIELESKIDLMQKLSEKAKNTDKNNNDDVFLTGNNEIILLTGENVKLKSTIEAMKKEISKSNDEKEALLKKIEQSKLEHVNYQEVIKQKDEEINKQMLLAKQIQQSQDEQVKKNQQLIIAVNNANKSANTYKREKYELEEIILKQEEKINELTSNVNKILNILKKKNENLKEKQSYVTKLEETIKDLNNEFKLLRHKSSNANRTEILYLKNQIERLQKENMTLKGEKIKTLEIYKKKYMFNKIQRRNISHIGSRNNSLNKDFLQGSSSSKDKKYISRSVPRRLEKIVNKSNPNKAPKIINPNDSNDSALEEASLLKKKILEKKKYTSGGSFYNININNNFKPIALCNSSDILMERQEKEKIEEFKQIINKLVNDISY